MRYRETLTVPITLDRAGRTPLHEQLAGQLIAAIRAGSIAPGTRMPSTRTLAALLGVSRGVAAGGYDALVERGFAEGRGGSGTYVTPGAAGGSASRRVSAAGPADAGIDLTPGRADAEIFPLAAWRSAWRQASCQVPMLDELPPLGLPALRSALAEHLVRTRGLAPPGREIAVTGGAPAGLRLVLDALPPGPVAVEHPAPPAWQRAVTAAGRTPVPIPVDADGVRLRDVPAGCVAVILSSDGHLCHGATLSADRRAEAAQWSFATGGTVVELACDAVFRPVSRRLPRLVDLAARTVLVGGLCDALTPALRLGYLVLPSGLASAVARLVADRGEQPPYLTQLAVTQLLADGTVVRTMHRRGLAHRRRRAIVEELLAPLGCLDGLEAAGSAVLSIPGDAQAVADLLRRRGITVPVLDSRRLLIGYGHVPEPRLRAALAEIRSVLPARTAAAA